MALTRQHIQAARREVEGWGANGPHYRAMAPFVERVAAYFDAEEERRVRPIPAEVIRDSMALGEALRGAGIAGAIAEVAPAAGDAPARYRVTIADEGVGGGGEEGGAEPIRLEGTVARLTALLGRMAR